MRYTAYTKYQAIKESLETGASLQTLAKQQQIPLRTLQRWAKNYRELNLKGLERSTRNDKGKPRLISQKIRALTEGIALQKPKKPVAVIYRLVSQAAERLHEHVPSYHSIYQIVKNLPCDMLTLAHEGTKTYEDIFDLLYRREVSMSNEIWQADHTLLDIELLNDHHQPQRPWLTIIMDEYSRAIAGYYLSFDPPSALQTSLALRQAIWCKPEPHWQICGIPRQLYTDHGSDFTSQHMEMACADLKIQLIFSTAGKPRGRGKIERFFRTLNQRFLCHLPGYLLHKSSSQTRLSLQTCDTKLKLFLFEEYNQSLHSLTKESPLVRWAKNGFLPQLPASLEQLDLLLVHTPKVRRIHQDGIRFQGLRYLDPLLAAYVGEDITIRYDPRDMVEIRVFYQEQFLCRAICQERAGDQISLKDIVTARRQRKRELQSVIKQQTSLVDQLLSVVPEAITEKRATQKVNFKGIKLYNNE